jgi:hypothetical protein
MLGDELHFTILSNKEAILKICRNIDYVYKLHGLKTLDDSVRLCLVMMHAGKFIRVCPHKMIYTDPNSKDAKNPKTVQTSPEQVMGALGMYMFINQDTSWRQYLTLFFVVGLAFFFLLFKVWPEWLRIGVYHLSWYLLVALIGTAIVRAIVWFIVFHIGVDFWIFPNYFIDSVSAIIMPNLLQDNIMDSFRPVLDVERREDMFDIRMTLLRVASAAAIFYAGTEFLKDP